MSALSDLLSGAVNYLTDKAGMPWHGPNGDPLNAGFRAMPRSPNIEDRRDQGPDYTVAMRRNIATAASDIGAYEPTDIPGEDPWGKNFEAGDPLVTYPLIRQRFAWGPGDPYWALPE